MYKNFYLLEKKPFENTPNPEFLYLSESHREVLASLVYGINFAKGFVLVAGNVGTGKTTMIQALLRELNSNFVVTHINNPRAGFTEIIYRLSKDLGLHFNNETNRLDSYYDFRSKLEKIDKEGKRTVLIIDEAHLLSEECLEDIRLLSNHETENRKLIQIVLVGQNEIYDILQKNSLKSLKQRVVINRILSPLDRKEVEKYIQHRLRIAGRQDMLFDRRALFMIWEKSGGVPRVINHLCDNALMTGYALGSRKIGAKIIKEVIEDMELGYTTKELPARDEKNIKKMAFSAALISLFILMLLIGYASKNGSVKHTGEGNTGEIALNQSDKQKVSAPKLLENSNPRIRGDALPSEKAAAEKAAAEKAAAEKAAAEKAAAEKAAAEKAAAEKAAAEKAAAEKAAAEKAAAEKAAAELHREKNAVSPNECLVEMARAKYGIGNDTIIDLIQMANPTIQSVASDCTGQQRVFPKIKKKDLIGENPDGTFHIHYASFYRFEPATKLTEKLRLANKKAFFVKEMQGDDFVFRTFVGEYETREEAENAMKHLKFEHLPFLKRNRINKKKVLLEILKDIQ
jgi:general secretion pathway protein A